MLSAAFAVVWIGVGNTKSIGSVMLAGRLIVCLAVVVSITHGHNHFLTLPLLRR